MFKLQEIISLPKVNVFSVDFKQTWAVWSLFGLFQKIIKNPLHSNTRRIFCFVPANCQPNATNLQHKSFMQLISLQ